MIKFNIVSRHKPGWSRERFYYEWAFIHVSLMLHTAASMRRFRRYVQHYANPDLPADCHLLPAPAQRWESIAEHWIEQLDTGSPGAEYTEQMQPHSFSDSAMEIWYLHGEPRYQRADFRSGGVKVFHRLVARPGISQQDWQAQLQASHAPLVVEALANRGLRKYELDLPAPFSPDEFRARRKGTLLSEADITPPAAVEEFWFDDLEAAVQLGRDAALRARLGASYAGFVDVGHSCSMIANERVVFDFVSPTERSPAPAVLSAGTLEATVFKTGRPYHEPRLG